MVPKFFLNYLGMLIYIFYPIISYQRIKVYRVKIMDIGRLFWNNGVSGKCKASMYCGIIVRDENPLVGVIRR